MPEMTIISLVYSISFKYSSFPTNCGQGTLSKENANFFLLLLSLEDTFTEPFSPLFLSPFVIGRLDMQEGNGQTIYRNNTTTCNHQSRKSTSYLQ